jgi:hypothetical protein
MFGSLSTIDLLKSNFQTIAEFGEDLAYTQLQAMLDAHNRIVAGMMTDLVEKTTDLQRLYGSTDQVSMIKTDEFGRPDAQKVAPGVAAGFPLDSFQSGVQWTRKFFQGASVEEVTGQAVAIMDADKTRLINEMQRAFYVPTNYTFNDYLMARKSSIPLNVRRLLNADGLGIPAGPNGEMFNGSTHTHYLVAATPGTPIAADYVSLLETVLEHYANGTVIVAINRAQETSIRAMTANFVGFQPVNVVGATTAAQIPGQNLQTVPIYNRMIGEFNGAEVWVKPWVIAGYPVVYLKGYGSPLCMRVRDQNSGDLTIVADDEKYPLRAKNWEREFGIGVWNRSAMAVLDITNGSYTSPTIAA